MIPNLQKPPGGAAAQAVLGVMLVLSLLAVAVLTLRDLSDCGRRASESTALCAGAD